MKRIALLLPAAVLLCCTMVNSQTASRSVWSGVYSADQATRGQTAFVANCSRCHGAELQGNEMAPPLAGSSFLTNWDKQSAADLAERIHTSMPPDAPGTLSQATVADIVAFILSANDMPASDHELPREPAAQKSIRIDALKPS